MGNADLHRLVKEMIKAEIAGAKDAELHLCQSVASILLKNFEQNISTRAVFILIELIENEATKDLLFKQVKAQKQIVAKLAAKDTKSVGLSILLKKLD